MYNVAFVTPSIVLLLSNGLEMPISHEEGPSE